MASRHASMLSLFRRANSSLALRSRLKSCTTLIPEMSVVQLFNRERKASEEFARRNKDNMLAWRDAILAYALFYPAVEFLSFATIALIYYSGGNRILGGTLSLGVLTAFTMYAQRFFRPIQDLSEKFNILQSAMAASERIFKLLDEP